MQTREDNLHKNYILESKSAQEPSVYMHENRCFLIPVCVCPVGFKYILSYSYTTSVLSATSELLFGNGSSISESCFPCTVGPGAGLPCWRLSAGCTFRTETPAPRSTERRVCHVPRQNSTFGDRSFAAAGTRTWNELPFSLPDTGLSLTAFNEHLKTYSFSVAF